MLSIIPQKNVDLNYMKNFNSQNERIIYEKVELEVGKREDLFLKEWSWKHCSVFKANIIKVKLIGVMSKSVVI